MVLSPPCVMVWDARVIPHAAQVQIKSNPCTSVRSMRAAEVPPMKHAYHAAEPQRKVQPPCVMLWDPRLRSWRYSSKSNQTYGSN